VFVGFRESGGGRSRWKDVESASSNSDVFRVLSMALMNSVRTFVGAQRRAPPRKHVSFQSGSLPPALL
jgi:hypothetical protein